MNPCFARGGSRRQEDKAEFQRTESSNGFTVKEQPGEASLQSAFNCKNACRRNENRIFSRLSILVLSFHERAPTSYPGKDFCGAGTSDGRQGKTGHPPHPYPQTLRVEYSDPVGFEDED